MEAQATINRTIERAHSICQQQGARLTEKRQRVLSVVLSAPGPLSAYEVADLYREQYDQSLSVMSVYRMLNFLKDNELVHRLETTNQYLPCSHISCRHPHEIPQFLICDKCHNVSEIGIRREVLKELSANIEGSGFKLAEQQLEFHGICEDCQSSQS